MSRASTDKARKWLVLASVSLILAACGAASASPSVTTDPPVPYPAKLTNGSGPAEKYDCKYDVSTEAYTGADATASAIGWEGNDNGVVTCLGGTFFVQDGIERNFGFGIYDGTTTTWTDADGYLPAQTTAFKRYGADVSITEFADKVSIGDDAYVAVYSRVAVHNPTAKPIIADPEPTAGMVMLDDAADKVMPNQSSDHDYVVAVDRFGHYYPWPDAQALADAGSFEQHFDHMKGFWNAQLAGIAEVSVPDASLDDAYKSGFIYTQIARSGNDLDTGVNGYESEFSHDVIGILANLFTQGYFEDAHTLLLNARTVVGSQGQYDDGIWTYSWPWALYLMKTGDLSFVRQNFDTEGPKGAAQPSIEDTAHLIEKDRTGPGGIMGSTDDIDTDGYWTVDDFEALMGLVAYRYLASRLGDASQANWATQQYDALLQATDTTLDETVSRYHLDYMPCSMLQPNTDNRCDDPEDANWAAPFQFGKWAWDAQLFDVPVGGPGVDLIDPTYRYGFGRLKGVLPAQTFGGYPDDYFSTGYNAGYGSWGLASSDYRDQGILSYEFMIEYDQSGPWSWWESSSAPAQSPWVGSHPGAGQGASPHAWGMSEANKVLLDSLAAQVSNGDLIVGRGVPASWLSKGSSMSVTDFPTFDGNRLNLRIESDGSAVSLRFTGGSPLGEVLFELPSFVNDIASTTSGTIEEQTGTVTVPPGTSSVTVKFRHPPK